MERNAITSRSFAILFIVEFLFSLVFPISHPVAAQLPPVLNQVQLQAEADPTTLMVHIISSPYAVVDANDPDGTGRPVPKVFLVEAVITNTGSTPAQDLQVNLDYHEDVQAGWILVEGENPLRKTPELDAGQAFYAYWLARYPLTNGATHTYTVTAQAQNAAMVGTSDNFYGNSAQGATVQVRKALNTGNTAVISSFKTSQEFIVGSTFTATVEYNLPNNPSQIFFSPVGLVNFPPESYRLLTSKTRLFNGDNTISQEFLDRLYFNVLPAFAENAVISYTFITYGSKPAYLCPFTAGYSSSSDPKYNKDYCQQNSSSIIPIEGTLNLDLSHEVSSPTIQQSQTLTYTIYYTNTGTLPLSDIWIWDELDSATGSIFNGSANPTPDPLVSTDQLIAWYFGSIPAGNLPGSKGQLQFSVLVDGHGNPLPDGIELLNRAYVGAGVDGLPVGPVYTSTVMTQVQAPTLEISKTDGLLNTQPGELLTYTLTLSNSGSIPATELVVSDLLPESLSATGEISPLPDQQTGQTLVWNDLGSLAPGSSLEIQIPVSSPLHTPDGTNFTNTASATCQNPAGFQYPAIEASDETTVLGPLLSIQKSASPEVAIAGATLTYTLSISNTGEGWATHAVVTDTLPDDTTFLSCSGGESCTENAGVVQWDLGSITPLSQNSVSFSVLLSDRLATNSQLTNQDYWLTSDQLDPVSGPPLVTTVYREAAFVQGVVFEDLNLNGILDDGEAGLPGLQVNLPGALETPQFTDGQGLYSFRVESQIPVSVSLVIPAGYTPTTSGIVFLPKLIFGETSLVNFGLASALPESGVVYGTVYEDKNHDGLQDLGESGISGVTVSVAGALSPTLRTNQLGQYTFEFETGGVFTVTQTDLPDYVSTTPNQVSVTSNPGTNQQVDFGDFLGIEIRGQVFRDANANGLNDAEDGLPAALVSAGDDSYLTAADGQYRLFVPRVEPGSLTVSETDPSGYVSTAALPGDGVSQIDLNTLRIDNPAPGTIYTGNDFGDTRPVDLSVSKQASAPAVAAGGYLTYTLVYSNLSTADAVSVTITDTLPDEVIFSGVTQQEPGLTSPDENGQVLTWSMPELAAQTSGSLSFQVLVKPDATGSITNRVEIGGVIPETDLENNQYSLVTVIGIPSAATIYGTVFDDLNGNGIQDVGEAGLPDVTVTLDGSISFTTDAQGGYYFVVTESGAHRVIEENPAGYFSTTPDEVHLNVILGDSYLLNFGDAGNGSEFAAIWGTVFDDADSDGAWDAGEFGLPGVTVTRDGLEPLTTNAYGGFTFVIHLAGEHLLVESDLPGYLSTTPNRVTVQVTTGHQYRVNFGDRVVSPCQPDGYENDDEYTLANSLLSGAENQQLHNFCEDPVDWLSFSAQAHTVYTMTTSATGQRADTVLSLYNQDLSTMILSSDDYDGSPDYSSRLVWEAPADGIYYLQVKNRAGLIASETDYALWLEQSVPPVETVHKVNLPLMLNLAGGHTHQSSFLAPQGVINHFCPDSFEVDDSWYLASQAEIGQLQLHSFDSNPALYAADKDFMWVDLFPNQVVTFTVNAVQGTPVMMELYGGKGQYLGESLDSQWVWKAPAAGRYFLGLSPHDSMDFGCADTVGYELLVTTTAQRFSFIPIIIH